MTTAQILVKAFLVIVRAGSIVVDVLTQKPDLDIAETEAALEACVTDLERYDQAWALLRDL